jgi:hypothetical protein
MSHDAKWSDVRWADRLAFLRRHPPEALRKALATMRTRYPEVNPQDVIDIPYPETPPREKTRRRRP